MRKFKDYLAIGLKGIAMGSADVVPGVSGGTIAFISGIYEELLSSIKSIDHTAVKTLFSKGVKAFWQQINGSFLLALFTGIGIAVVSLVKVIHFLLDNHPVLLWSFFFGLIVSSVFSIGRKVTNWNIGSITSLLAGIAIAYYITIATPAETPTDWWFIVFSGMIAICAMILPGISGAFIMVLLGAYKPILSALNDRDYKTVATVFLGAIVGLLVFSKILKWMFTNYKNYTLAILTGFIVGSLNKIWPWKENGKNILPFDYSEKNFILPSLIFFILGILFIFGVQLLEKQKFNVKKEKHQ